MISSKLQQNDVTTYKSVIKVIILKYLLSLKKKNIYRWKAKCASIIISGKYLV